jgi:hypothetical protein
MEVKHRRVIRVETHRMLVAHIQSPLLKGWCPRCGRQTERIALEEATQAGVSLEAISHLIDQGRLHLSACAEGLTVQQLSKGDHFDENHKE